jgi:hypothetical protein
MALKDIHITYLRRRRWDYQTGTIYYIHIHIHTIYTHIHIYHTYGEEDGVPCLVLLLTCITIIDTIIHHILHIHYKDAYYYDTYLRRRRWGSMFGTAGRRPCGGRS